MKKPIVFCLLFSIIVLTIVSCNVLPVNNAEPPVAETLQAVDGLQRTVVLDQPAQRIVSLAPSATEILFAVGAGSQVVGRDTFSNYPEATKAVQDIGGSMGSYSYELIKSLKPDLVFAAEINTPEQVKSLEDLGLKVYYISNPAMLDGLYPILETVGKLTGHVDEANQLSSALQARVEIIAKKMENAVEKPLVFYELDGSEPAKPWTPGPDTFFDQLVQLAGGRNVGATLTSQWAQISVEALIVADPDMIILGDSIYGVTAEQVASRPGWNSMIKDRSIYEFNDDLVSRPGPRLVDGLEALAKLIHPELFK